MVGNLVEDIDNDIVNRIFIHIFISAHGSITWFDPKGKKIIFAFNSYYVKG